MSLRDVRVVCRWSKASGKFLLRSLLRHARPNRAETTGKFLLRSLLRHVRPNRAKTTTPTEQATISAPPSLFCQILE
jgi:hypothetical protein